MKYFIDTEFHEGFHKAFMKPNRHFIDLISIGIVAEDNREYYAISKEFDIYAAWNKWQTDNNGSKVYWLRDNVLKIIFKELYHLEHSIINSAIVINGKDVSEATFNYDNFKKLIKKHGKTNEQIAEEIKEFVFFGRECTYGYQNYKPEFYAYYADYDWVAFCSLFGSMMQLPKSFPMYCKDLKQDLDNVGRRVYAVPKAIQENIVATFEDKLDYIKSMHGYPKQEDEHNALSDAKWNKELHKFLNKI